MKVHIERSLNVLLICWWIQVFTCHVLNTLVWLVFLKSVTPWATWSSAHTRSHSHLQNKSNRKLCVNFFFILKKDREAAKTGAVKIVWPQSSAINSNDFLHHISVFLHPTCLHPCPFFYFPTITDPSLSHFTATLMTFCPLYLGRWQCNSSSRCTTPHFILEEIAAWNKYQVIPHPCIWADLPIPPHPNHPPHTRSPPKSSS